MGRQTQAFTLLEILIVVAVIGLLAVLAIPAFAKARTTSIIQKCIQNERAIFQGVQRYEIDTSRTLFAVRTDGVAIRNTLMAGQYVMSQINFDCPGSQTKDFDDYTLAYTGSDFTTVQCTITPATHVLP